MSGINRMKIVAISDFMYWSCLLFIILVYTDQDEGKGTCKIILSQK